MGAGPGAVGNAFKTGGNFEYNLSQKHIVQKLHLKEDMMRAYQNTWDELARKVEYCTTQ